VCAASPIVVSTGQSASVDSATGDSYVVQSGSLMILPGASISSVNAPMGIDSSVTMSGGQVDHGIDILQGSAGVTGGRVLGGNGSVFGGDGLFVFYGSARIEGGTFIGGDSKDQAGSGVVGSAGPVDGVPTLSALQIDGGTFVGGSGSGGFYGGKTGYSLVSIGNTTVTGGNFLSPIAINATDGGTTEFLGFKLAYNSSTHVLSGILKNGDRIDALIYSLNAAASVNASGTEVSFSYSSIPGSHPDPSPDPLPEPIPEPSMIAIFGLMASFALVRRHWRRPA